MIGVILCGGLGTRLRAAVPDLPKSMALIRGRPFLEYQIEFLERSLIREIVLCVGYRWDAIHAHFGDGDRFGVHLHYSLEHTPLGTAGCLKLAEGFLNESALILNGDTFLSFDPAAMQQYHQDRGSVATVAVRPSSDNREYGTVVMDQLSRIIEFREKQGGAGHANAGAYLIEPPALHYLKPGEPASLEYDFLPALLRAGEPVYGYPYSGPFLDIGTPQGYQTAQEGWV